MGLMFSGIDLKSTYNFVVTRVDGRGSPPVSRDVLDMPRVDGDIEINSKLKSRNLVISGYVYGTDAATKKDNLIKLITQAYSQEKKLTFPDTNRSIYVKLAGEPIVVGPLGPVLNAQAYEITFNFVAQDPYFYADEHNEAGWGYIKVNADAPTYLMSPRKQFLRREPTIELYPVTVVNLLGKYGNFEIDSNGDGLADGWIWSQDKEWSTDSLYGSHSQKIILTDSPAGCYRNITQQLNLNDIVFGVGYLKVGGGANSRAELGFGALAWEYIGSIPSTTSTSWTKLYLSAKYVDDNYTGTIYFNNRGDVGDYTIADGLAVYNLTEMSKLPPPLKEFFNNQVSNWEDLATTSNIIATDGRTQTGEDWLAELLPYVDSCASLGFAWGAI